MERRDGSVSTPPPTYLPVNGGERTWRNGGNSRVLFVGSEEENCFYVSEVGEPRKTYDYALVSSADGHCVSGFRDAHEEGGRLL